VGKKGETGLNVAHSEEERRGKRKLDNQELEEGRRRGNRLMVLNNGGVERAAFVRELVH